MRLFTVLTTIANADAGYGIPVLVHRMGEKLALLYTCI